MESTPRSASPSFEAHQQLPGTAQPGGTGGLPTFLTSFVGRDDEIDLASSLLQRPEIRLLTLTGPGGIGKSRLAVEIAAATGEHFHDGARFVSLAAIQDPSMVMVAIAAALGLHELDGARVDDVVASALNTAEILLVVDNFEHVMDAAPALTMMLARCPRLKVMVTSRSLLRVEGEHSIPVPPLVLPRRHARMTHDDWLRVPVIKLFIERAEAVAPSLSWGPGEMPRLVEICERLDGLPLAVELAATRMRHFSLAELNDRLTGLLPLLIDGSRDHPSRLQTMRNAIAWSYDLLSPDTRELLRHASVFRGGFTLDAIVEVERLHESLPPEAGTGTAALPEIEPEMVTSIEDRLSRLIDASLLMRETRAGSGAPRYRMLETIREFASEQLQRHGHEERALRAHATYVTAYAARHEVVELLPEHVDAMDRLVAEQDNLRAALAWLQNAPDRELFVRLVGALGRFWLAQSAYREGKAWFERALAVEPTPASADSARIQVALGMAEVFLEENAAAEAHLVEAVSACREHGDVHGAALALIGLAGLAIGRGDAERSARLLEESLEAAAAIPDARLAGIMAGWVAINLAVVARSAENGALAKRHIEDALARFRAERFHVGVMMALGDLGDLARDRGDWSRALALYQEALVAGRTDQARRIVIEIIESVAIVAIHSGQPERSTTLFGAAEGLRERVGLQYRQPTHRSALDAAIAATRRALPADRFAAGWAAGRQQSFQEVVADVLALHDGASPSHPFDLTAREFEVLELLATGMTDPEIADVLFISVRTVEHHVARILRKLGVRTRAAATSTAIAAGLVAAGGSA